MSILLRLLAPMTPHLAEELWEMLGHTDGLWVVKWPAFNAELAKEEEVEIVVQFNGKLRSRLTVAFDANDEAVREAALDDEKVKDALASKQVVKIIVVKNKLVNIVVKG